ncbi:hypothetical protein N7519_004610 [Penicillium mononematosum]|uniref:uncharacterized protein n=1 Tax=Penicillium mononematosum TaxID=268346 RepID=UPI0025467102|nr:uncharacterized protein N7519_004610 [Penicillium mononematosum]KAJ6189702.1 hypothetical protein N7519_004610 [Penicillium mononematosum]
MRLLLLSTGPSVERIRLCPEKLEASVWQLNDSDQPIRRQTEPLSPPRRRKNTAAESAASPGSEEGGASEPSASPSLAPEALPPSIGREPAPSPTEAATLWDPVDPLGLFDELEGPLHWPSQGLFA